jgi:putative acetyltransferase
MNVLIRSETAADVESIESVTATAFLHAEHTGHNEQFIVNALRAAGALSVSLVAQVDGQLVGHVAMSPVSISGHAGRWYGLAPVSVLPEFQRRGIGTRLVTQAMADLKRLDAEGCVVLGDPRYYGRFGFKAEPGLILEGVPAEYFQAISFAESLPSGTVTYHRAFNAD